MTGFLVPTPVPAASGWTLSDWRALTYVSPPAAGGVCTIAGDSVSPDETWLLDRLVIQCSSSTPTTFQLYNGTPDPSQILDGTSAGNLNTADYPAGLLLRPASTFLAQWTGASTGAIARLTAQVRVMRRYGQ